MLLDVIVDDPRFGDRSETALRAAASTGALVVCECVLAEIRPAFTGREVGAFLDDWGLEFVPASRESALLAGEAFTTYLRRRRGRAGRVLPDFLIAAHARVHADRLLARDRGYYRDYFERLALIEP